MLEHPIPSEKARVELQWTNHLLDSAPHDPSLWLAKGVYFRYAMVNTIPRKVLLERVLLWFQQCVREDPSNWVNHYNVATVLRDLNRHEEALLKVKGAVDLKPDSRYAQTLLVQTLVRLGLYEQAREAFERALQHGCLLDPDLIGLNAAGGSKSVTGPDSRPARAHNEEPETLGKMFDGKLVWVFEASDPELFTLQCEFDELVDIGLFEAAEAVCVHFEIANGPNGLTRSCLDRLKALGSLSGQRNEVEVSGAYPLLEIATRHLPSEYLSIVNYVFEEGGVGKFITPQDVNDFDEQARWHLGRLSKPVFRFNDPSSAMKPMEPELLRVWNMATLNFVVARKLGHPLLIAYTATTLADFYDRLGESNLPVILYKTAAVSAEQAGQLDYFVNARGKCALILRERNLVGSAVNHLEKALQYAERIVPLNRFHLYFVLGECYSDLADYKRALECYEKAETIQGVPEEWAEKARDSRSGLEIIAGGRLTKTGIPPVQCKGLELQSYKVETPHGPLILFATSRHEFYDCLLQAFDNVYLLRQSLLDRETGFTYFQRCADLMEALVRAAFELELFGNSIGHLESQKSLILNNRLKYLVRQKPADLPNSLWDDLQRLVSIYRRMVEKAEDPEGILEPFADLTLADVADAISAKLWECRQVSGMGARQIEQKLAFSRFPEVIECTDPEHTRILEFCSGVCFIVRPDSPQNPEAVALPEATPQESERLAKELFGITEEWLDHYSHSCPLTSIPPSGRFERFLGRFNEVFYRPLAAKLDALDLKRLCIVPHRILHVLPLNLLGMSEHPRGGWGERFDVSFAPSLTSLASLGHSHEPPARCLIVADPVPACPLGTCRNPTLDCFSMPGTGQESRNLETLLKGLGIDVSLQFGRCATLETVAAELGSADIVHVATHGWFNVEQPEESGLLLSLPQRIMEECRGRYLLHNGSTADRAMTSAVGEILTLDYVWKNIDMFSCKLINLAACSTAMVDWSDRTDEFYGIANGFLYAGAQSILSNLWPVHDLASEIFNQSFYEHLLLQEGTAITALKTAVGKLRNFEAADGAKPFAHPFFWAGYRVIGF